MIKTKDTNLEYINKIYRYMKNGMSIEDFMQKFHLNYAEFNGILELCRIYDKSIDIVDKNGTLVFEKNYNRTLITTKPDIDDEELIHTEIGLISDTHSYLDPQVFEYFTNN